MTAWARMTGEMVRRPGGWDPRGARTCHAHGAVQWASKAGEASAGVLGMQEGCWGGPEALRRISARKSLAGGAAPRHSDGGEAPLKFLPAAEPPKCNATRSGPLMALFDHVPCLLLDSTCQSRYMNFPNTRESVAREEICVAYVFYMHDRALVQVASQFGPIWASRS